MMQVIYADSNQAAHNIYLLRRLFVVFISLDTNPDISESALKTNK